MIRFLEARQVTNTGQIEESELEERFVRVLRNLASSKVEEDWKFEDENIDGVINYRLHIKTPQAQLEYFIQPQYQLGKLQGVQYSTRADFLIRCLSVNLNGQEWTSEDLQQIKPIAIYLDGYQFHATKENPRFAKDVICRHAILASGAYHSWTLTYQDVLDFENQLGEKIGMDKLHSDLNSKIKDKLKKHPLVKNTDSDLFARPNNLSRLVWILENATQTKKISSSICYYLSCFQEKFGGVALQGADVIDLIHQQKSTGEYATNTKGATAYCTLDKIKVAHHLFDLTLFSRAKDFQLQASLLVRKTNENYDKKSWSIFWTVFNLLQFTDFQDCQFKQVSEAFQLQFLSPIEVEAANSEPKKVSISDAAIAEILSYYEEEFHAIVTQLLKHNIPFSQEGSFELMEESGSGVLAEAVLGFP